MIHSNVPERFKEEGEAMKRHYQSAASGDSKEHLHFHEKLKPSNKELVLNYAPERK